jgi:hypothetical protein
MKVAHEFRKGVDAGTHIFHFKRYSRCFIGSEAVDYMVNSNMATSRKDAVLLGQRLSEEINLFHHVKREHKFSDDFKFYRYPEDDGPTSVSTHSERTTPAEKLDKIAEAMRKEMKAKNRRWYHKVYKKTFLGTDAITYLVNKGAAETRKEAVQLGRELAQWCNLFEHVEGDHELKDEGLFYRFIPVKKVYETQDIRSLRSIADQFERDVEVKDQRFHLRIYKDAFVGEQAVSFLASSGIAKSREEAAQIGRSLETTFNLFEHVTREHGM